MDKNPLRLEDGVNDAFRRVKRGANVKKVVGKPKTIRRKRGENPNTERLNPIEIDIYSKHCLKLHALQRKVSLSALQSDILNGWLALATDYDQAIFKDTMPLGARAASVPERWVGYLASLGFAPETEVQGNDVPPPPPAVPTAGYGYGNAAQSMDLGTPTSVHADDIDRFNLVIEDFKPR